MRQCPFDAVGRSGLREWSNDGLKRIAGRLGVSRHALLLRFVSLKRASWDRLQQSSCVPAPFKWVVDRKQDEPRRFAR
jgi:hypothetical protein